MSMCSWSEVSGKKCSECGYLATHWYCGVLLCCDCHVGHPPGSTDQEWVRSMHEKHAKPGDSPSNDDVTRETLVPKIIEGEDSDDHIADACSPLPF